MEIKDNGVVADFFCPRCVEYSGMMNDEEYAKYKKYYR